MRVKRWDAGGGTNHVGPKRRGMPLALSRPSFRRFGPETQPARRLGRRGSARSRPSPLRGRPKPPATPRIYHKGRNFRIPFNLNAEGRDRVKELHLLVSEDLGYHWRAISKTFPDHPTFTFRSSHDGEYWFAVQTRTIDGKVSPTLDATVEPNLKVVVDSFPPSLLLEPDGRRGSLASVRWEVKDENLDLKSLVLEYQVEGAGAWRRVPIRRPKLIGGQQWDAGTAEALKVRASVADKAGNVTEAVGRTARGDVEPARSGSRDPGDEIPRRSHRSRTVPSPTSWPGPVSRR